MWHAVHAAADSGVLWTCQMPLAAMETSSASAAAHKSSRGNPEDFQGFVAADFELRFIRRRGFGPLPPKLSYRPVP